MSYSLELARSPSAKAMRALMREVGLPPIPPERLARIAVPASLIWGRLDKANRLRIAEAAGARYGWPLHVVDDCADDPHATGPRRSWAPCAQPCAAVAEAAPHVALSWGTTRPSGRDSAASERSRR